MIYLGREKSMTFRTHVSEQRAQWRVCIGTGQGIWMVTWDIIELEMKIKSREIYPLVPSVPKTGTLKLAKIAKKKLRH